jgi:hypothetical protein
LGWQYAVGGGRFSHPSPKDVDRLFVESLKAIVEEIQDPRISSALSKNQITDQMRLVRSADPDTRQRIYAQDRLAEQLEWYSTKAERNQRRATQWRLGMLAFQAGGAAAAVCMASGLVEIDLLGVMGAAAASVAAWLQAKDHATLAQAYDATTRELWHIKEEADRPRDESEWATFVESAERAISREHTMWLARHGATPVREA